MTHINISDNILISKIVNEAIIGWKTNCCLIFMEENMVKKILKYVSIILITIVLLMLALVFRPDKNGSNENKLENITVDIGLPAGGESIINR